MERTLSIAMVLVLAACGAPEEGPTAAKPTPTEAGASEYAYVLGVDGESSIVGGAHLVQRIDERREAFGIYNRPSAVHPELIDQALIYDPTLTSGVTDWEVFPSSWWPMAEDGVASRWLEPDELSPAEKYDALFRPDQLEVVAEVSHWYYDELDLPAGERPEQHTHPEMVVGPTTAWELTHHGVYQSVHPDSWWGHCNGWASYAVADPGSYPERGVSVRYVDREVVECLGDTSDCVRFRRADIEALMSEVWFNDAATFGGQRCDVKPEDIERDELGRPLDSACRDLNPGTFHVILTQLLGVGAEHLATGMEGRPAVVVDYSADWQVWNFPVVGFRVVDALELEEAEAAELLGLSGDEWPYNAGAKRFVRVQMVYTMISDDVGPMDMVRRADQRDVEPVDVEVAYVLELDADDRILGGEWVDDPSWPLGPDSMELHPDFVWIPTDHQGELERPGDLGGSSDNPFVGYPKVQQLLDCANDPATCAPESDPDPDPDPDPTTDPDPDPHPDLGTDPEGNSDDGEAGGCGCASARVSGGWLALALPLLVGRRRRGW